MADNFAGMIADRLRGAQRARLTQFYREQGYEPAQAAAMATAELARREQADAPINDGDSPRESIAVRTANDALAQRREMSDRDMGDENRQRIQNTYRSNPMLLGLDQPSVNPSELPGYDPTRTEGGAPNRYDSVYKEVQTGSGEPIVRFSDPVTEDEIIARRGAQPNIYERMYGGVKSMISPLPDAESQGSRQPPTYSTPSYPVPSEGGSATTNRLIDRAFSALSGNSPAAAAPAPAASTEPPADARSMPQDVEGWGRKVEGPSASTYSMDSPPNSVGSSPMRRATMPLPPKRPESMGRVSDAPSGGGFFSGMFKDPYEGKSSRDLYQMYNDDRDNNALYFRAAAKQAQERKDAGATEEGMKRGGAAGSPAGGHHKDAAIMKALEIIHHMLRRG